MMDDSTSQERVELHVAKGLITYPKNHQLHKTVEVGWSKIKKIKNPEKTYPATCHAVVEL